MAQALYKTYGDRRPCGAVALSNCFGLLVYEPTEEDRPDTDFITAWSGTEGKSWGFIEIKYIIPAPGVAIFVKVLYGFILMKL